jgi:hypothetical protein
VNRQQTVEEIGRLHRAWSIRYGDRVPYNPDHENPHNGVDTDLAIWNADRSAPAEWDDQLNQQIVAILAQIGD